MAVPVDYDKRKKRGSSAALGKKPDPYKSIRDGNKQKVKGQANVPTARQKKAAGELAASVVGGPLAGKLIGKAATKLAGVGKNIGRVSRNQPTRASTGQFKKPSKVESTVGKGVQQVKESRPVQNIQNVSRGGTAVNKKGQYRKPNVVEKVARDVGRSKRGESKSVFVTPKGRPSTTAKGVLGIGAAAGAANVGSRLYDSVDPMPKNKKVDTTKPKVNKESSVNKISGYQPDPTSSPKITSKPKAKKAKAKAKDTDTGYKFYGKKGTGLGDFSRKYGIQYATQKQFDKDFDDSDGEKAGGRPGRGKMKTQGMNRSKRSGFSGRGAGAAQRGF